MAQLIMLNSTPVKNNLVQKSRQIFLNTVFNYNRQKSKIDLENINNKFCKLSRELLQNYLATKHIYQTKARARGLSRSKINIIVDMLIVVIVWRENIKQEAQAIFALANNICENITATTIFSDDKSEIMAAIEADLANFFSIQILWSPDLHKKYFDDLSQSLPQVQSLFYVDRANKPNPAVLIFSRSILLQHFYIEELDIKSLLGMLSYKFRRYQAFIK